jgi:hypothetical protein
MSCAILPCSAQYYQGVAGSSMSSRAPWNTVKHICLGLPEHIDRSMYIKGICLCALPPGPLQATQFQPILEANIGINVYDITKQCDGSLCYGKPLQDAVVSFRTCWSMT